jgi:peptidoglycan hydrolase CwlO-like protein
MVVNINTRKLIEVIKAEIKIRETKIQALQEMIESPEQKINDQDRALSAIEGLSS